MAGSLRATQTRKLFGRRHVVASTRRTSVAITSKDRIVGFYTGGCLKLTGRPSLVTTTGTKVSSRNFNVTSIHFVYNARSDRGRLRRGLTTFLKVRSTVLCSSYFSTGNNLFRALLNTRSTVVSSTLGRTSVVSNIHLYGTGHCHCTGGSVRRLRTHLGRTHRTNTHRILVTASNMFSVSNVVTGLGNIYSLTSGCSTLIVMSSSRTINFINRGNHNSRRCYSIVNQISVVANALNGTLNKTSNNCATTHGRIIR